MQRNTNLLFVFPPSRFGRYTLCWECLNILGIENTVVREYGRDYWDKHKKDILRTANKNRNLNSKRVGLNARDRRRATRALEFGQFDELSSGVKREMRLHPTLYNASDLKKAGVIDASTYKKIRSKPKRKWEEILRGFFSLSLQ